MHSELAIVLMGVLPAIVLTFYIYLLDKNQREPLPWVLKAFGYGVGSALAAVMIEYVLDLAPIPADTLEHALYDAFIVAATSEESMKLLFLIILLRKNPYFDERMDCIVYASCVSMGFAGLENITYLFEAEDLANLAVTRALCSVPGHFFFGVFMGYFMSLAIWGKPEKRRLNWVLTLLVPIILHGIYDACLMSMPLSDGVMAVSAFLFLALGVYVWTGGHRHIFRVLARDKRRMPLAHPWSPTTDGNHITSASQAGEYNKDEKSAPVFTSAIDEEKRAVISALMGNLIASRGQAETLTAEATYVEDADEESSLDNKGTFRHPFSFNGRIRRKEFCYSFLIYWLWYRSLGVLTPDDGEMSDGAFVYLLLTFVPMVWFNFAQSCKRCHDLGHSGWWQIIPFYSLWLIFRDGDPEPNEYGESPK